MKLAVTVEQARSSKSTLWDLRRSPFFRQTLGTYGTQLLVAVISLATSAIVARALGPAGRGDYAVAMAIGLIGVQLGNLGLQSSNSYFVAKDRLLLPNVLANSQVASFAVGGGGAAALGFTFHLWANAPVHGRLLWLAALWIPLGLAYLFSVNLFMALLEVRLYNFVELLNRVLSAVFIVIAVALGARTPEIMFLVVLLALLISVSLALERLRRLCPAQATPSLDLFRKNFQLGWKAYLCCLFSFLVIRIDLLMVKSMMGAAAAGYYSIAGTIADYVLMLPVAVGAILFPRLSGMVDDGHKRALTLKAVVGTGLGLLGLLVLLGVSAKFVIFILFGRAFAPATAALLLLSPGIFFLGVETVLVQYLNSCGFPVSIVLLWAVSMLANIGANLWAIPAYGINGAAAVSSGSYLLALAGVLWVVYRRRPGVKPMEKQPAPAI